jgi:hypothetical protein
MSYAVGSLYNCECGEMLRLHIPYVISETIYRGEHIETTIGRS